jgi:hypothetical protein
VNLVETLENCGRRLHAGAAVGGRGVVLDCKGVARLFADSAGEQMSVQDSELLEAHLKRCPVCRAFASGYWTLIRLVRQLSLPPVPPRILQRLRCAVRKSGLEPLGAPAEEYADSPWSRPFF